VEGVWGEQGAAVTEDAVSARRDRTGTLERSSRVVRRGTCSGIGLRTGLRRSVLADGLGPCLGGRGFRGPTITSQSEL
jgi:hypothetical protein